MIYSNKEKGDIVNWDTAQWDVSNMVEYEATYDKICRGQDLGELIFSSLRNYTAALTVCQNVHGNLIQVENEAQQQKAVDIIKNSSSQKRILWISRRRK